jgi:hypothetical protein
MYANVYFLLLLNTVCQLFAYTLSDIIAIIRLIYFNWIPGRPSITSSREAYDTVSFLSDVSSVLNRTFLLYYWLVIILMTLLFGRSRDRFPVMSLDFSMAYSFRPYHRPGIDSAPSESEYHENFLGVKAAGAWDWQPHHLHVPNVMEIWEPKPPGTLLATSGLLRDCFTFTFYL